MEIVINQTFTLRTLQDMHPALDFWNDLRVVFIDGGAGFAGLAEDADIAESRHRVNYKSTWMGLDPNSGE